MPSFPIAASPVQISQSITQDALIQNTGEATVYLSNESAVSSINYSLRLTVGGTVNWPANRDLWAAVAPGDEGLLSVLYNAGGTALAEVTASIPGTVSVDVSSPVLIQGGGTSLFNDQTIAVPGGSSSLPIDIPAPPNGLVYPSLRITFNCHTPSTTLRASATLAVQIANGNSYYADVHFDGESAAVVKLGEPNIHEFLIPNEGNYPINLQIFNHNTIDGVFGVQVNGSQTLVSEATTELATSAFLKAAVLVPPATASDIYVKVPCAFRKYGITARAVGKTALASTCRWNNATIALDEIDTNITYNYYTGSAAALVAGAKAQFEIPGGGWAPLIKFFTDNTAISGVRFNLVLPPS